VVCAFALTCAAALPADAPLIPVTVCEAMRDLASQEGKALAVLGRYSFRESGVSLGEQACDPPVAGPAQFRLLEDAEGGPKPPDRFEVDGAAALGKLAAVKKRTSLGKFPFGTPDYDRWAVVYGRVAGRHGDGPKQAPADLVFRGDGVVVFLPSDQ
jgi:hypothetical protein